MGASRLLFSTSPCIFRGDRRDTLCWRLKGDGKFDTRSYYQAIQGALNSLFPWKGVWKPKIPKRVAFFLWTVAHDQILTLDNFLLRGRPLVNRYPVTHTLWTLILQAFGIHWVMLGSMVGLLSCWYQWLGKHNSNIWNLILGCLMWIVVGMKSSLL